MTVAAFLAHSVLLVLIAALSPVLFLNASRVVEAAGIAPGLWFASGAVCCLLALGIPTMGLMGAATSQQVEADLASRGVDLVLALVLIAYGVWQVVRSRGTASNEATIAPTTNGGTSSRTSSRTDDALPTTQHALFATGLLGMLTNFTTLPLFLSVAQRIGIVQAPNWVRAVLLISVVLITATPVWLPVALRSTLPGSSRLTPQVRLLIQRAIKAISIGACFLGGALIIWHVLRM